MMSIYTSLHMWCNYHNKIVHMAADDKPILFRKIAHHGIKTKPGSVVVSQADPHSWIFIELHHWKIVQQ